uniref:Uncharacterized protein n=1 Tax=Arundo donax TaxID=35708 RepID=A0A0A9ACC2_ARUDO
MYIFLWFIVFHTSG